MSPLQGDSALTLGSARSAFLPFDGSRVMARDLNMDSTEIINLKPIVEDDIDQSGLVIDFNHFHTQRDDLKRLIIRVSPLVLMDQNQRREKSI